MKTNRLLIAIFVIAALLLASCGSNARVGALHTESQSVDLGNAKSVRVDINMGAGSLEVSGGAEKLLEADFTYNVARLKPEVDYTGGRLVVEQPDVNGMPALLGITSFRNEWGLRLSDDVPMDLHVDLGGGTSNLKLAGLSLTGLELSLGAGDYLVDLSGGWARDLDVTINSGAANTNLRLPSDVGVRVTIEPGPNLIDTTGLEKDGHVYTNAAYGVSDVTMQVHIEPGIGLINLEVDDAASASSASEDLSQK